MCVITMSTSMAIASAVAMVATTATSTALALSQASIQKKSAAYQIEQSKREAKKAEMQAAFERQEGIEDARRQKINAILNLSNEKAKLAGNNISMSSETVLNIERDVKMNSELDALTTQNNAEKRAQNYLDKRNSLYQNAILTSFNSKVNTRTSYSQLGNSIFNNTLNSFIK